MGKTLDGLRHLQEVEMKLGGLRKGEASKRRQIDAVERQLKKCDADLAARTEEVRQKEAEIHAAELEIASRDEIVQRHRVALNQAKTNKDYAAILTVINTEKADASKLETRELELMNMKEQVEAARAELLAEREKLATRQLVATAKLNDYLEKTRDECARLEAARDEAAEMLLPSVRNTFERAAERHEGEALAAILQVNPKRDEYVCGGCNMGITLEMVNSLRTRDEIVLCNICGRILYYEM